MFVDLHFNWFLECFLTLFLLTIIRISYIQCYYFLVGFLFQHLIRGDFFLKIHAGFDSLHCQCNDYGNLCPLSCFAIDKIKCDYLKTEKNLNRNEIASNDYIENAGRKTTKTNNNIEKFQLRMLR